MDPLPGKRIKLRGDGLFLDCALAGSTGPLVLLLHGFPDTGLTWRLQVDALSRWARVLVPDLRGYGASDRPSRIADYAPERLIGDVTGLIDSMGEPRAHVVGHDWGGVVAWWAAAARPERIDRMVILNAPEPGAFRRDLFSTAQLLRSWYILFFQVPWLPETLLTLGRGALVRRTHRAMSKRGAVTHDDLVAIGEALSAPGAAWAALAYYRAAFRALMTGRFPIGSVQAPTRLIWGEGDTALGLSLTTGLEARVPHLDVKRVPGAGHWVHRDEPATVNTLIETWLQGN